MRYYDLMLWADAGQSALQQMTPQQRQMVFSALAIIVLLGVFMILLVSLSARMMRRYVRGLSQPDSPNKPLVPGDDWARKPMIEVDLDTGNDERDDA